MIIILAGNVQQYADYCREQGVKPFASRDLVFADKVTRIMGIERGPQNTLKVIGNGSSRIDAARVLGYAARCSWTIEPKDQAARAQKILEMPQNIWRLMDHMITMLEEIEAKARIR